MADGRPEDPGDTYRAGVEARCDPLDTTVRWPWARTRGDPGISGIGPAKIELQQGRLKRDRCSLSNWFNPTRLWTSEGTPCYIQLSQRTARIAD